MQFAIFLLSCSNKQSIKMHLLFREYLFYTFQFTFRTNIYVITRITDNSSGYLSEYLATLFTSNLFYSNHIPSSLSSNKTFSFVLQSINEHTIDANILIKLIIWYGLHKTNPVAISRTQVSAAILAL